MAQRSGVSMAAFQKHFFVYFFPGMPQEISLHSEPKGKSRGGVWGPLCGCSKEVNSQIFFGHYTVNLLIQMMREAPNNTEVSYATFPLLSVIYGDCVLRLISKPYFLSDKCVHIIKCSQVSKRKPNSLMRGSHRWKPEILQPQQQKLAQDVDRLCLSKHIHLFSDEPPPSLTFGKDFSCHG